MRKLPKWCITDTFPSLYDNESATAIEQTAKLYGAVNDMIDEYNVWVDRINNTIEEFINDTNGDYETFKVALRQEFQDFIDVVNVRIQSQDSEITNAVNYMKTNLRTSVRELISGLRVTGELNEDILACFEDFSEQITAESEARSEGDNALREALENETQTRESDKIILQKAIDDEVTARENANSNLQKAIDDEVTARENAIDELKNYADVTRKYIFITDSYGNVKNAENKNWIDKLCELCNIPSTHYYALFKGSTGFTRFESDNWLKQLQDANIPNKNEITDIICAGGANDALTSYEANTTAIKSFFDYAKVNFPNAKVQLAHIGVTFTSIGIENRNKTSLKAYRECHKYGGKYITNSEYVIHNSKYFEDDKVHPTAEGVDKIAYHMTNAIFNGECAVYEESTPTATISSTAFSTPAKTVNSYMHLIFNNGILNILGGSATNLFELIFEHGKLTTSLGLVSDMITLSDCFVLGNSNNRNSFIGYARITTHSDGNVSIVPCIYYLNDQTNGVPTIGVSFLNTGVSEFNDIYTINFYCGGATLLVDN